MRLCRRVVGRCFGLQCRSAERRATALDAETSRSRKPFGRRVETLVVPCCPGVGAETSSVGAANGEAVAKQLSGERLKARHQSQNILYLGAPTNKRDPLRRG